MRRNGITNIALVSPYDFASNGGVTEHIQQLALHLERHGVTATIIAPSSADSPAQPNLVSLGAVTPIRINGSVARPTLSPMVIEEVSQLLRRQQFDVIHLHEPLAPMLPLSVLNASTSANVGTFHAFGQRSLAYASGQRLLHWLAQRLTVRIAVSEAAATFVGQYFPGDYTIIPNGVDAQRFRPDVVPWPEWQAGGPKVLFVGRFDEPRKGFDVLLQAWPAVLAAYPDARLLVVGRGDADVLQQRIAEQQLGGIELIGPVAAADLPRWYRTADIFCAPSTGQESFGIILAEAMSSGTPVIASDIDGYRSVVTNRREGLLVPAQQPAALAASLIHVLAQPRLREAFGISGRATALTYDWSDVSLRVIQTYERAVWMHQRQASPAPVWFRQPQLSPALATALAVPFTPMLGTGPVAIDSELSPSPQGDTAMLTEPIEAQVRAVTQRIVGRTLGRFGISPNALTAIGLLLTLSVTVTLASGYLRWGGVLVLLTSAFDMLDGALARATDQKSSFGAFLDSTVDRYAEALIFLGLLLFYQQQPAALWVSSLVYLTIVGSLMVSYTRARAEALGFECKVGLLGRPERIILLAFGLIVGWLPFALGVLAIFTNFTAAQRVLHVWQQGRERDERKPAVPTPSARNLVASGDQQSS